MNRHREGTLQGWVTLPCIGAGEGPGDFLSFFPALQHHNPALPLHCRGPAARHIMAVTTGTSTDRDAPGIHDTTSVKRGKRSSQGAWSLHTPWTGLAQPEGFCSGWMVLCSTAP